MRLIASIGPGIFMCLLITSCFPQNGKQDAGPARHTIEIKDFRFEPADLAAAPGDTITWINKDFIPHTATEQESEWDSGQLGENDSWSLVVTASYKYFCVFHPQMKGSITTN